MTVQQSSPTFRHADTGPFPGYSADVGLDLPDLSPRLEQEITARLVSRDFDAWATTAARVGHCTKPIRLRGHSQTVDTVTGEVLGSYSSDEEPLGVLHVRCGNRRASDCPSCSRVYAADTFHLIRAGVVGGKGVPDIVRENPLVFATLTAPSFGPVHGTRNGRRCRPYRAKDEAGRCPHNRPTVCHATHLDGDRMLGQPLCGDCYDYESHVVWQWWAPELWRRFTIALRRALARALGISPHRLAQVATVQFAKVAEYQLRGLVHFHALVRVDGKAYDDASPAPAPAGITAALLSSAIESASASVWFDAPPLFGGDLVRRLRFGSQVDSRPVRGAHRTDDPDKQLEAEQVAGYLAKYATKSATDSTNTASPHLHRLRSTIAQTVDRQRFEAATTDALMAEHPYALLGKWAHMLGFRGHFSSKSRRYSVTLGRLRRARARFQRRLATATRDGRTLDTRDLDDLLADDDTETTLVVGHWTYAGSGWDTDGDAELARAAAARAREHAQWRAAQPRKQTN
ncbi:replication initiator [Intrasporangium sp. YIM S08009]|uniref:replication initiator n=1 Tax=Intrasporangium zincisolvens TaxID=3080018 RepID=UPI002B054FEC|nr:replication initiator [Intrasporangium sp. YIM S08009]